MRVLYLITRAELGGAQVHVHDLLQGFQHSCEMVLGVGEEGYLTEAAAKLNIPVEVIPDLVQPISLVQDTKALFRLKALIRSLKPDLVHAHTSKAGMLGRAAAHMAGVPSVFTAHTWSFAEGTSWQWKAIGIPCEKLMSRLGSKTITVSDANRSTALQHRVGSETNLVTIHNGIPDSAHRARHGRNGTPRIVMVARCALQKNQLLLLRALSAIKQPFQLSFVGDGPTRSFLEAETGRLGLQDRVEFLGNRRDVAEILAGSDIFALPTNWEGFPLSILEAMRAGLPVVATEVGGVREAVEDDETGFLVPGGAENDLRERLAALLSDCGMRQRMGNAGRARYERDFTISGMLRKTHGMYRSLLSGGGVRWPIPALQVSG